MNCVVGSGRYMRWVLMVIMVFGFCVTPETRAISQRCAWFGATVTGLVTATPAFFLPGGWKAVSIPLFGAGLGIGRYIFYQFTPDGRMESAENILYNIDSYRLAQVSFDKDQTFDLIDDVYITQHWPLITAFNDLTRYIGMSRQAKNLAAQAEREDYAMHTRALDLYQHVDKLEDAMRKSLKLVKSSEEYLKQLEQFKAEQYHREQIQIQKNAVSAQWSNAEAQHKIAQAQQEIANAKNQKVNNAK